MLSLLIALAVPPAQSGGGTAQDAGVMIAYLDSRGPIPRLPLEFSFPVSVERAKAHYPSERYVIRSAESKVMLVVDKRISWIKSKLNGAILMRELAKRPNPFAAVQISQLSPEAQEAAIGYIDTFQPKVLRALSDQELRQASIALNLSVYVAHPENGRRYAPAMPLRGPDDENKAVRDSLLAHPIPQRTPTDRELAEHRNELMQTNVIVQQLGGNALDNATYLLSASKEFVRLVEELRQERESSFASMTASVERLFAKYLGGIRIGGTTRLSSSDGAMRRDFEGSFLSNWKLNGFSTREEALAFIQQDQLWKINPIVSLQWSTGTSSTGTPSFVEVEMFRTR